MNPIHEFWQTQPDAIDNSPNGALALLREFIENVDYETKMEKPKIESAYAALTALEKRLGENAAGEGARFRALRSHSVSQNLS